MSLEMHLTNQCFLLYQRLKKSHMILSVDTDKAFDQLGIQRKCLKLVKNIYKNPIASIRLNDEMFSL